MNSKNKTIILATAMIIILSSCSLFKDNKSNSSNEETIMETKSEIIDTKEEESIKETNLESKKETNTSEETESETKIEDETILETDEVLQTQKEIIPDEKNNNNNSNNSSSNIDKNELSNFSSGDKISIDKDINVYLNADDAFNKINSSKKYSSGNYYIYKITDKSINISSTKGNPGGWINLDDANFRISSQEDNSTSNTNNNKDAKVRDVSISTDGLSTKAYSWSWAYPGNQDLLEKYNGIYKKNDTNTIYLTFDNGYEYKNLSSSILDTLKENNVKSVFFVTSSYIKNNPKLTKRMIKEGHIVANHTEKHLHQGNVSANEVKNDILGWERDYEAIIGSKPTVKLMRPPAGSYNEVSLKIAYDLGYKTVFWSYAYGDYDVKNQPEVGPSLKKALENNKSGSIVLLHSISETNAKILDDYIKQTKNNGYNFKLLK